MAITRKDTCQALTSGVSIEAEVVSAEDKIYSFTVRSDDGIFIGDWLFEWDLGDGTISDSYSPIHMYTEAGSYTVTLQLVYIIEDSVDHGSDGFLDPVDETSHSACYCLEVA